MESKFTFDYEGKNNDVSVFSCGNPSFDNLVKWEREALINPLFEAIKEFYKDPSNRQKYIEWKRKKEIQNLEAA